MSDVRRGFLSGKLNGYKHVAGKLYQCYLDQDTEDFTGKLISSTIPIDFGEKMLPKVETYNGRYVIVEVEIRGKEYENKHYVSLFLKNLQGTVAITEKSNKNTKDDIPF